MSNKTLWLLLFIGFANGSSNEIESERLFQELVIMKHSSSSNYRGAYSARTSSRLLFLESANLLGKGYNLISADPHTVRLGDLPRYGSGDPGLTQARIFKQKWTEMGKTMQYLLPDGMVHKPHEGEKCRKELDHELIPGIMGYRRLLLANTVKTMEDDEVEIKDCKRTALGSEYKGKINKSQSDQPCQLWPDKDHNYCRNPEGQFQGGPSCYVNGTLQLCDIDFCRPRGMRESLRSGAFLLPYMKDMQNLENYIFFENKLVCTEGYLELEMGRDPLEGSEGADNDVGSGSGSAPAETVLEVTEPFKIAACELPRKANHDNLEKFVQFFDAFGTNVMVGAEVGQIHLQKIQLMSEQLGDDFRQRIDDVVYNYLTDVDSEGNELGVRQYMTLDLRKTNQQWRKSVATRLGPKSSRTVEWFSGSEKIPKPISLTLMDIDHALQARFWRDECDDPSSPHAACCQDLELLREAVSEALDIYPAYKQVFQHIPRLFEENILVVEMKWPAGYYALPFAGRCPEKNWKIGTLLHSTHQQNVVPDDVKAVKSFKIGLWTGWMAQRFCNKLHDKDVGPKWPKGSYCINRVMECPQGFEEGFIYWPDFIPSMNMKGGHLPDGEYGPGKSTTLRYCCREDAPTFVPMILPTHRPFYLMMIANDCQQVHGMTVEKQSVFWDSSNFCKLCSRSSQQGGLHPRNDYQVENNKLYYCHYKPKE